ncbi:hypothetical protein NPIL_501701 [Nephila pilipes]|uniref:Uncharacterized protein n=1 Tax=Nephila pilipes TaxID=299642 RepID=A0A8X6Q254_NEPPI|nr:hypothetical protein NPIL_501701 [Nephila pilipes]
MAFAFLRKKIEWKINTCILPITSNLAKTNSKIRVLIRELATSDKAIKISASGGTFGPNRLVNVFPRSSYAPRKTEIVLNCHSPTLSCIPTLLK